MTPDGTGVLAYWDDVRLGNRCASCHERPYPKSIAHIEIGKLDALKICQDCLESLRDIVNNMLDE